MELIRLDTTQAETLYTTDMTRDFPESELKPWPVIRELMEKGIYEVLTAVEGQSLLAYAWNLIPEGHTVLLDYLAVRPEYRGRGVGIAVLDALRKYYSDRNILLESEEPEYAPEPETARRRLGFYSRAGFTDTGAVVELFGVRFRILAGSPTVQAREEMESLYRVMLPADTRAWAVRWI